jgi:hypothetical protein
MAEKRLSIVALSFAVLAFGAKTLSDEAAGRVLTRTILTTDATFDRESLSEIAAHFARRSGKAYRLAVLDIVTDESRRVLHAPFAPEAIDFNHLVALSKAASQKQFNIARVVVCEGRAALQVHYKSGRLEHTVLGNYPDPVSLSFGDIDLRLLELGISAGPLFSSPRPRGPGVNIWYLCSRLPDESEARNIWQTLHRLTGLSNLRIAMRTVAWWDDPVLPLVFPFEEPGRIVYANWAEQPWLAVDSLTRGVVYQMFDGKDNRSTVIIPK